MEPPSPAPPSAPSTKLRLMCSYGGHIVPRPHSKSLFYSGGDTRIVCIPAAATLSSLTAHLAAALSVSGSFTLKYQLPGHDLDSLISLSTDDDLLIMLEELQRLAPPSRLRLFLFPPKSAQPESTHPESAQSQSFLCHPRTETWFIDALNSARMMQKGDNCPAGFGQNESLSGGGLVSAAESIVLETNSSFGSTSSSVSLTNLPSTKTQDEDAGFTILQDNKAKSPPQDSLQSNHRGGNAVPQSQTWMYAEQVAAAASMEVKASPALFESEDSTVLPCSGIPSHQTVPFSGFPMSMQYSPLQQHHQFVQTGTPYLSQQPICLLPISSGQPMYQLQPQQLYHPNQPYPVYVLPSAPPQPYGLSMQCGLADTRHVMNMASFRPSGHSPIPHVIPQMASGEASDPSTPSAEELTSALSMVPPGSGLAPLGHLPPVIKNLQQAASIVDIDQRESSSPRDEFDDDPARVQIYKSQPPLPTLPSQYQTMTKATTVLLSEAFAQLHTDVSGNR